MTDSMNFGPEWLRNLSSSDSPGSGTNIARYQLAEHRYGREEMLALYDRSLRPPHYLSMFPIYSEKTQPPLALAPASEEERVWQPRVVPPGVGRGRGGSLDRGRGGRGRGAYQSYARSYEGGSGGSGTGGGPVGWGNGEQQSDWSPRKEYSSGRSVSAGGGGLSSSYDNWRRHRGGDEDDGWRSANAPNRGMEKWGRSTSWREGDATEERNGPPERTNRSWHRQASRPTTRRSWDDENLPEWATENMTEGGGTFDATGAFHGSDDEQVEGNRGKHLQKSVSQQNIGAEKGVALSCSRSAVGLSKVEENGSKVKEESSGNNKNEESSVAQAAHLIGDKHEVPERDVPKSESNEQIKITTDKLPSNNDSNGFVPEETTNKSINRVEEDFDKIQEDLVLKLVVDEEVPKTPKLQPMSVPPPPNLVPPVQDKWYYQDPQGDMQGPFTSSEMCDWFRHGYFQPNLMVRRQCDDHFYTLADLTNLTNSENPFEPNPRFAPVKLEGGPLPPKLLAGAATAAMTAPDVLQYQLQQQLLRQAAAVRALSGTEPPWAGLSPLQQRDLIAQQMMAHGPVNTGLQYIQQQQTNPLMQMISQIQQANKLPGGDKTQNQPPPPVVPTALDPIQALVQQMGGLQSLQNRLPGGIGTPGLPATLSSDLPGLQTAAGLNIPNLQPGIPAPQLGMMGSSNLPPRPTPLGAVDPLNSTENDPIKSLLRQLQQKPQNPPQPPQLDSLWQQNQYPPPPPQWQQQATQPPPQPQQQPDVPISMWDIHAPVLPTVPMERAGSNEPEVQREEQQQHMKEVRKRKEQEEKLAAKKEAEEKKKIEAKKQEAEKKAAEEKRKKEEERLRKEQEKAKREAEDKRLRELEEKRRLKEQRKAEEAAKKKAEEMKKQEEEEERRKREAKEREEQSRKQQTEVVKPLESPKPAKAAPWCKSGTMMGASLEEIQKAEKIKKAEQLALMQKRAQQQQELQQTVEKANTTQFKWVNRPLEPRKVKSLAEIQAEEEHERLAKQMAEARLQKEKEIPPPQTAGIWSGQNLTWTSNNTSQWSNNTGGFWDEVATPAPPAAAVAQAKQSQKQPQVLKSVSASAVPQQSTSKPKQVKSKAKREEQQVMKVFNNGPVADEFTEWCIKALKDIDSNIDVPTFVGFLRDIESAIDVRDYCRDYLGDGPTTQQFTNEFLEKRRSYKPKVNAHKDDMCSPAPAITPSAAQHSTEFQEVKGKSKKGKKSKMAKVDSRFLGFNVTAAHDRINVGGLDRVDI